MLNCTTHPRHYFREATAHAVYRYSSLRYRPFCSRISDSQLKPRWLENEYRTPRNYCTQISQKDSNFGQQDTHNSNDPSVVQKGLSGNITNGPRRLISRVGGRDSSFTIVASSPANMSMKTRSSDKKHGCESGCCPSLISDNGPSKC